MNTEIIKKIDEFFSNFKLHTFKKGEIIVRAEEDPPGILYLTEGAIKQYAISNKGEELVVNIFKPISFFPMSWAMNNTPNHYFFEATSDVALYSAPVDQAIQFIKNNPDVLFDLMKRVYKGTDGLLLKMTYLMAGNAYGRLMEELLVTAKRFGEKSGNTIVVHISEKDLAAQSGMTRETVSREIKILKEKKLLQFEKNTVTILDLKAFENEVGQGV